MRIMSIVISLGVGGYVLWKLGNPLPFLLNSCLDKVACEATASAAASDARRPGLRVELYDPALESRLGIKAENDVPFRISSSEYLWIEDGVDNGHRPPRGSLSRRANLRLEGLGQPGAHGVCLIQEGGHRRCIAVIQSNG